jgi:hypothetical protein
MLRRWLTVGVVAALVVLAAVPVVSAAERGTDRPFTATLSGEVTWSFTDSPRPDCAALNPYGSYATSITEGFGTATHLGAVESHWSHCPASGDYLNDGRVVLIAANGDELRGVYDYPGIDVGTPIVFTGGTGRFEGASGEAVIEYWTIPVLFEGCDDPENFFCLNLFTPWQWYATLNGTISY